MPASYIRIHPVRQRFADKCRAYPELFAVVGNSVPDLRGLFLRGHGGNSAALGVQQGDAIRNITGSFGIDDQAGYHFKGAFQGGHYVGTGGAINDPSGIEAIFDASLQVPTAEENRPVNTAVRFLVRARP